MKKTITLLATTTLFVLQTNAQQLSNRFITQAHASSNQQNRSALAANTKPQKEAHSRWDTVANAWVLEDSTIYNYNAFNNVTQDIRYSLPSGNKYKTDYTYNANQKETNYTGSYSNGGAYVNSSYSTSNYDANNNKTSQIYQYWDLATSSWENSLQQVFTYNASNQMTNSLYATWNGTTSAWVNNNKLDFTYNVNGEIIRFDGYNWNGSAWLQNRKGINITWYQWTGNLFESKLSSYEDQEFDGTNWVNGTKTTVTYDAQGNETQESNDNWTGTTYLFNNRTLNSYVYDANNNMTKHIFQDWYTHLNNTRNTDKYDYSRFNTVVTSINELSVNNQIAVYPNPTQNTLHVNVLINGVATIYNTIGSVVYTQQLQKGLNTIDMSTQPDGIYFVNFNNQTVKFMKQ